MKHILLTSSVILFCSSGFATVATCTEKTANLSDRTRSVEMKVGEKNLLFKTGENTSYLTEKKIGFFSIEMFMGAEDQRLYAEGPMDESRGLTLAFWGREALIEIECKVAKP